LKYFIRTEIIGGIELFLWMAIGDSLISSPIFENSFFGMKYIVIMLFWFFPILFLIADLQSNKRQISNLIKK